MPNPATSTADLATLPPPPAATPVVSPWERSKGVFQWMIIAFSACILLILFFGIAKWVGTKVLSSSSAPAPVVVVNKTPLPADLPTASSASVTKAVPVPEDSASTMMVEDPINGGLIDKTLHVKRNAEPPQVKVLLDSGIHAVLVRSTNKVWSRRPGPYGPGQITAVP